MKYISSIDLVQSNNTFNLKISSFFLVIVEKKEACALNGGYSTPETVYRATETNNANSENSYIFV